MRVLRVGYVYIPRRGNIVSSLFILIGRLAKPKIHGRKATSLTSFLFLYPILIAKVRRLAWQKNKFNMHSDADCKAVAVYSTNGALVEKIDTYAGEEITLDKGIYIVRVGDKAIKVKL